MAAQAIWTGTISFSLVAIPVRLVSAVRPGRVSFHLLHRTDHSRLSRRYVCSVEGTPVPPDEIVRGYELLPGTYITMTDEELESVSPERSRTIEITDFIDAADVDHVYYDHPYYLLPAKGGEKAYQLLTEVLRRSKKAGLARFVFGEREYPVAVMERDGALALTTLHTKEDILPIDVGPMKEKREDEARMRKSIEAMLTEFEPTKYSDRRGRQLRELLTKKIEEHAVVEAPAAAMDEGSGPVDLVAALEESMRSMKGER